ncbi:unnamed protein product [Brassicogethes aeneus]|uniref:Transmembrane protein 70 homolog, mitochondrial n=1 Tax=Brassicogethes aeneus TaxID=1431903 RepID=A0A9P0ASJ5_BRAAE|nr:unnamed protein product [Brassicogethes aeneus]
MSFKVCIRLLSQAIKHNNLNAQLFNASSKIKTSKCHIPSISFVHQYSTKAKEEANDRKPVYYGVLTPQIKAVKFFSLSSSFVGLAAQPFLYNELSALGNVGIIVAAYSFIGFFTLVTPLMLHFITKKYVTHVEYNIRTGNYIAKTVNFFCVTKELEFKPKDVVVPDVAGMFTTFEAKGKALFMDPRHFDDPTHYEKIMGYDKPIDFKLYDTPSNEKKN